MIVDTLWFLYCNIQRIAFISSGAWFLDLIELSSFILANNSPLYDFEIHFEICTQDIHN